MGHLDGPDALDELDAIKGFEEDDEEDAGFAQQPPSAPHPTPLPISPSDANEEELANSLAAIPVPVGRHRGTPFRQALELIMSFDNSNNNYNNIAKNILVTSSFPSTF